MFGSDVGCGTRMFKDGVICLAVPVGNMDGSNDVRNPNAFRNPKPIYASVVAADAPAGSNANHRREMEKQDRMKKVSFLLFNPVR